MSRLMAGPAGQRRACSEAACVAHMRSKPRAGHVAAAPASAPCRPKQNEMRPAATLKQRPVALYASPTCNQSQKGRSPHLAASTHAGLPQACVHPRHLRCLPHPRQRPVGELRVVPERLRRQHCGIGSLQGVAPGGQHLPRVLQGRAAPSKRPWLQRKAAWVCTRLVACSTPASPPGLASSTMRCCGSISGASAGEMEKAAASKSSTPCRNLHSTRAELPSHWRAWSARRHQAKLPCTAHACQSGCQGVGARQHCQRPSGSEV